MPDTGVQILESLRGLGVTVVAIGPDRLRLEPASKIPAEMVPRIREAKPAILEVLRNWPASCSTDCYELEPGIWIHRPWAGCATSKAESSEPRKVTVTCWHCRGEKSCACIACWKAGPGECMACEGSGHVWRWVQ